MPKQPFVKVLCCQCRKHLYHYYGGFEHGVRPRIDQFKPATPDVPAPTTKGEMTCVACRQPWYMMNVSTGSLILLTDQGWKPRAPKGRRVMVWEEPYGIAVPEVPPEFQNPDFKEEQAPRSD